MISSYERDKKSIEHIQPDVISVGPFIGYAAAGYSGVKIYDYITYGKILANCQYELWEKLQHDIVITAADTYYMAMAFGLEVNIHENALLTAKKSRWNH